MAGGKFVGWLLDGIPNLVNWIGKKRRVHEIDKIDSAIAAGDDKSVGNVLRKVVKSESDRRKADS